MMLWIKRANVKELIYFSTELTHLRQWIYSKFAVT